MRPINARSKLWPAFKNNLASASARVAARLPSHAITMVLSNLSNGGLDGNTKIGRPLSHKIRSGTDLNTIDYAHSFFHAFQKFSDQTDEITA